MNLCYGQSVSCSPGVGVLPFVLTVILCHFSLRRHSTQAGFCPSSSAGLVKPQLSRALEGPGTEGPQLQNSATPMGTASQDPARRQERHRCGSCMESIINYLLQGTDVRGDGLGRRKGNSKGHRHRRQPHPKG